MIEMDIEEQPLQLPVDEEAFEKMLEEDERFVSLGHDFYSLKGVDVNREKFKKLIAMGMVG